MGKPSFSKFAKFFAFALLGAATAIAALAVLSSPAAAQNGGGGGFGTLKPWDTDNLAYGGYSARNFRVPFHEYGGYSAFVFSGDAVFQGRAREACQSAIADGFSSLAFVKQHRTALPFCCLRFSQARSLDGEIILKQQKPPSSKPQQIPQQRTHARRKRI